jgi:hypothetical protein
MRVGRVRCIPSPESVGVRQERADVRQKGANMPAERLYGHRPQGQRESSEMRSIDFHPSSRPPVSDRDLERYADKWVAVHGGKVVLRASSYDALVAKCASRRSKKRDRIIHLPPVAAS